MDCLVLKQPSLLSLTVHNQNWSSGLYYKSYMIVIYDRNDSTITIYNLNDSGLYYKTTIVARWV